MNTWYRAVCDFHKEACQVMVDNPIATNHYLKDRAEEIQKFLTNHSSCELRLIHRDDQLDDMFEKGYRTVEGIECSERSWEMGEDIENMETIEVIEEIDEIISEEAKSTCPRCDHENTSSYSLDESSDLKLVECSSCGSEYESYMFPSVMENGKEFKTKCSQCGEAKDCVWEIDPYKQDVLGIETDHSNWCDECYGNSCEAI